MVGEDIKVSYIADSNTDFPIETQTDFQIALYVFRRKARMGEIVNLKLDKIPAQSTKKERHSNDVETQFDNNETVSLSSTCCTADTPPEWFISYMKQVSHKSQYHFSFSQSIMSVRTELLQFIYILYRSEFLLLECKCWSSLG